jgi:SAM-dependent methyltransferase
MVETLATEAPCLFGGKSLYLRYRLPKIWTQRTSRPFGIYWSRSFSYGRLWPEPTATELSAFYEDYNYSLYLSGKKVEPTNEAVDETIISRLAIKFAWLNDHGVNDPLPTILALSPNAKTACDIGCGGGIYLEKMRSVGAKPTGLDPSAKSEKALAEKDIEFFFGTAEHLPLELQGREFDIVSMFQSLEHCRDPVSAVSNAASILTPDGLLVIDVPNMACAGFETYAQVWWHTDAGRHLYFFTRPSLDLLLSSAGLTPIKWEYAGFAHQFSRNRIGDMVEVWDAVGGYTVPPRPSLARSLSYLPYAMLSHDRKYEIIRVYATRRI